MSENNDEMTEAQAQLIVSMRIYDVLMAIYTEMTDGTAKADHLMAIHQNGGLLGPLPALNLNLFTGDLDETPPDGT